MRLPVRLSSNRSLQDFFVNHVELCVCGLTISSKRILQRASGHVALISRFCVSFPPPASDGHDFRTRARFRRKEGKSIELITELSVLTFRLFELNSLSGYGLHSKRSNENTPMKRTKSLFVTSTRRSSQKRRRSCAAPASCKETGCNILAEKISGRVSLEIKSPSMSALDSWTKLARSQKRTPRKASAARSCSTSGEQRCACLDGFHSPNGYDGHVPSSRGNSPLLNLGEDLALKALRYIDGSRKIERTVFTPKSCQSPHGGKGKIGKVNILHDACRPSSRPSYLRRTCPVGLRNLSTRSPVDVISLSRPHSSCF